MYAEYMTDLKSILMEESIPFYSDEDLMVALRMNNGDFNAAAYDLLVRKSMDSTVAMSGLTLPDTSKYFLRIAQRYRPFNSGTLKGG